MLPRQPFLRKEKTNPARATKPTWCQRNHLPRCNQPYQFTAINNNLTTVIRMTPTREVRRRRPHARCSSRTPLASPAPRGPSPDRMGQCDKGHHTSQHIITQHSTSQRSTAQHSTAQKSGAQRSTVEHTPGASERASKQAQLVQRRIAKT